MVGEFGSGTNNYAGMVLEFARQNDLPWIAWCLHPHARPCLIMNWTYAPTTYGQVVKDALQKPPRRSPALRDEGGSTF